jgi:hypothetical protein
MQMMQMHEKYRFSNLSHQSIQDGNNSSIVFSDDSGMMMMVSDEGHF